MQAVLQFPDISPIMVTLPFGANGFPIYWYAVAYIVGIIICRWIVLLLIRRADVWRSGTAPLSEADWENLVTWMIVGIIAGGRIGYLLFYADSSVWGSLWSIINLRDGGMSFHGGFAGVILAGVLFCWRKGIAILPLADAIAVGTPPALFLGRLANFVNAELWGRETTVPWGVIFPGVDAQTCVNAAQNLCARHPSQLYEALGEGLILGVVLLYLAFRTSALKRTGLLLGLFVLGYGFVRFLVEFVRQPDAQFTAPDNPIGYAIQFGQAGLTMGQLLSLPMIILGAVFMIRALRMKAA